MPTNVKSDWSRSAGGGARVGGTLPLTAGVAIVTRTSGRDVRGAREVGSGRVTDLSGNSGGG